MPFGSSRFTGRAEELRLLDRMRSDSSSRSLTVVSGLGGVGKTTLAAQWLQRITEETPDGQLYADLGGFGVDAVLPERVLAAFLRALGASDQQIPDELPERTALFRTMTADKAVAVLLDNAGTAAQVRPLLPTSAQSIVVVTSRVRLIGLGMDGARFLALSPLDEESAVELLASFVGSERAAAERDSTSRLARQCGCLPVALSVAGAQLAARPRLRISRVVTNLDDQESRLTRLSAEAVSVESIFDLSYGGLPSDAARLYRRLGWHPGREFGLAAAAAAAGESEDETDELLETLLESNLLEERAEGRLRFHDLLRLHARSRCAVDEGADAARAVVEHYLRAAVRADLVLMPLRPAEGPMFDAVRPEPAAFASPTEALAWLLVEHDNLTSALRQAIERGWDDLAWQFSQAMWGLYLNTRRFREWIDNHRQGVAAARRLGDPLVEARLLVQLTVALSRAGRFDEVVEEARRALRLAEELDAPTIQSTALAHLGEAARRRHDGEEALRLLRRALSIEEQAESGTERGAALRRRLLGRVLLDLGRYDEAITELTKAKLVLIGLSDVPNATRAAVVLGDAHARAGDFEAAQAELTAALAAVDQTSSVFVRAEVHRGLGELHHRRDEFPQARVHLQRALVLLGEENPEDAAAVRERLSAIAAEAAFATGSPDGEGALPGSGPELGT
nr:MULTISPECIES: tetratricopeptide repeat protein [Actinoalloteichus]